MSVEVKEEIELEIAHVTDQFGIQLCPTS